MVHADSGLDQDLMPKLLGHHLGRNLLPSIRRENGIEMHSYLFGEGPVLVHFVSVTVIAIVQKHVEHHGGSYTSITLPYDDYGVVLDLRMTGEKSQEHTHEIGAVKERIEVLSIEFLKSGAGVFHVIKHAVRESRLPRIDIEEIPETRPGKGILDEPISAAFDTVVEGITGCAHTHQSGACRSPRPTVEEYEERFVCRAPVCRLKGIPNSSFGRHELQSGIVASIVEIKGDRLHLDETRFMMD
jgi:hypothetical protein